MERAELLRQLNALASDHRLSIIKELTGGPLHVSALARRVGLSRPLLYMHITRLEEAGMVRGELKITEGGRLHKYFENVDFTLEISTRIIAATSRTDPKEDEHEL